MTEERVADKRARLRAKWIQRVEDRWAHLNHKPAMMKIHLTDSNEEAIMDFVKDQEEL